MCPQLAPLLDVMGIRATQPLQLAQLTLAPTVSYVASLYIWTDISIFPGQRAGRKARGRNCGVAPA